MIEVGVLDLSIESESFGIIVEKGAMLDWRGEA